MVCPSDDRRRARALSETVTGFPALRAAGVSAMLRASGQDVLKARNDPSALVVALPWPN